MINGQGNTLAIGVTFVQLWQPSIFSVGLNVEQMATNETMLATFYWHALLATTKTARYPLYVYHRRSKKTVCFALKVNGESL